MWLYAKFDGASVLDYTTVHDSFAALNVITLCKAWLHCRMWVNRSLAGQNEDHKTNFPLQFGETTNLQACAESGQEVETGGACRFNCSRSWESNSSDNSFKGGERIYCLVEWRSCNWNTELQTTTCEVDNVGRCIEIYFVFHGICQLYSFNVQNCLMFMCIFCAIYFVFIYR